MPECDSIPSGARCFGTSCRYRTGWLWLVAVWCCLATGCAGGRHLHYQALSFPDSLQAPEVDNPQIVQWGNLAMPAASNQSIGRGDVLEVTIAAGLSADNTTTWPIRVNNYSGVAELPDIGSIPLAGLTLEAAEAAIMQACITRGLFRSPNVTVTFKQQYKNSILVLGGVKEPGRYELSRDRSSLLAAIFAAGGLSKDAGSEIKIRRVGEGADERGSAIVTAGHSVGGQPAGDTLRINLVHETQAVTAGHYIPDGAVVVIEKRDPQPIQVLGLVKKSGSYPFPHRREVRVLDVIALAGGLSSSVADKVFVIRKLPDQPDQPGRTAIIEVSLMRAKRNAAENIRLQPQDIVTVEHTAATVVLEAIQIIRFGVGASLNNLMF